jgi:hypothetical protein
VFIFCRLKINHEPHEFILDSGTAANIIAVLDMSLAYIGKGSIHVVEHHDDLFSWKKYNQL